ncbi:aldehyde dehydrogenase family protein [Streptomyces sp. NPDC001902]
MPSSPTRRRRRVADRRAETFGPVPVVIPCDDEDETVRIANDSPVPAGRRGADGEPGARP